LWGPGGPAWPARLVGAQGLLKCFLAVALLGGAVIGGAAFAQTTQPTDRAATASTGQPAHAQMALKLMGLNIYNEANE
jgi:hypothetical protein